MKVNKYVFVAGIVLLISIAIYRNHQKRSNTLEIPPSDSVTFPNLGHTESTLNARYDNTSNDSYAESDSTGKLPPMKIKYDLEQTLMMLGAKLEFLLGDQLNQYELNQLSLDLYTLLDAFAEYASDRTTEIEKGNDGVVYQFLMTEREIEDWRSKYQNITKDFSHNNDQATVNDYLFHNFSGVRAMTTITPHLFIVNQDSNSKTRVFHEYTDNLSGATFNKVHTVERFNKQFFGKLISGIDEK